MLYNHTILQQYENNHPNIIIEKEKTVSVNDFEIEKQYILLYKNEENPEIPAIFEVVYQGKRKDFSQFLYDKESGDLITKKRFIYGFKSVSKPRFFYDIPLSDIDKDCFFYTLATTIK